MEKSHGVAVKPLYEFPAGLDDHGDVLSQTKRKADVDADDTKLPASNEATPQIALAGFRFALRVLASLAVLLGVTILFVYGVVIDTNVVDDLGSSKNVDAWVETYQVVKGFATAAFGMVMEGHFMVFVVVASTFLQTVRWFPGDDPRPRSDGSATGTRLKSLVLVAFAPVVMFVLNVAISAMFVGHKTTGVVRVFLQDDLVATTVITAATVLNATTAANLTSLGNGVSVLDTILRGAMLQQAAVFALDPDSKCVVGNTTSGDESQVELPSVKEVRSTAVVYGFPALDWNVDALPFGLKPTHSVVVKVADRKTGNSSNEAVQQQQQQQWDAFQQAANVSWLTMYELLLQGKLLFERSVSDADVSAAYPCVWVDGKTELDGDADVDADTADTAGTNASSSSTSATATNANAKAKAPSRRRLQAAFASHHRFLQATTTTTDVGDADGDVEAENEADEDTVELELSDFFDVFPDGPYQGKRRCFGAVSTLGDLRDLTDPRMHKLDAFVSTLERGFVTTTPQIEPESMDLTLETFAINPELTLTAMTLDMPYYQDREYRNTSRYCNGTTVRPEMLALLTDATTTKAELEALRELLCDQDSYPYWQPRATCGHTNCVFLDQSGTLVFRKQLQLMPYLTNCSTATLTYDADLLNFFPRGCVKHGDAVFLYGLGSYMTGESFDSGYDTQVPYISKPRRHVVLTFAKLEWRVQDLSAKFHAECGVNATTLASRCTGLLHNLENVTVPAMKAPTKKSEPMYRRVLVLGQDQLPADRMAKDFRNPVQLVTLNARPFYYKTDNQYYEWQYLDLRRFNSTDWPETIAQHGGLDGSLCSPVVDAYISQLERNHWFMDDPRQPLYTSALLYLFQNAAVKSVKVATNAATGAELLQLAVVGTTALKGDLERHDIKFSIPLLSLAFTFAGVGLLLLLAIVAVLRPLQRFKMSSDADESATQQYLRFHEDDEYPSHVLDRGLKLPTGERVAMDDYVVESLTLHHVRDTDKKMYL